MTQKQALKAARKRGLVSKAEADLAKKMMVKRRVAASGGQPTSNTPTVAPVIATSSSIPTDAEALWVEFKLYHGTCSRCQGADVFCGLLPLREPFREGLVIQRLRREEHKRLRLDRGGGPMPEEVKQELRQRAAEKRASRATTPREKGPGVIATIVQVCSGEGATKDQVLQVLARTFPQRETKGMASTISIQLGGRLAKGGYKVQKIEKKGQEPVYRVSKDDGGAQGARP